MTHFLKVSPIKLLNLIGGLDNDDDGSRALQNKAPTLQVGLFIVCGVDRDGDAWCHCGCILSAEATWVLVSRVVLTAAKCRRLAGGQRNGLKYVRAYTMAINACARKNYLRIVDA